MIYTDIVSWRKLPGMNGPVWLAAFEWLEKESGCVEEGVYQITPYNLKARVMMYSTKKRENALYESHRCMIDIQYTIKGAERIEFCPLSGLQSLDGYCAEEDVEHFKLPVRGMAQADSVAGCAAVIFPGEPHMPQLRAPGADCVQKVVIKIPEKLVS